MGQKYKLDGKEEIILSLLEKGKTQVQIAKELNVTKEAVRKKLIRMGFDYGKIKKGNQGKKGTDSRRN